MEIFTRHSLLHTHNMLRPRKAFTTLLITASSVYTCEKIHRYFSSTSGVLYAEQEDLSWLSAYISKKKSGPNTSLPKSTVDAILRKQEYTTKVKRNNFEPIAWFETNHYNANHPIEDRHCECSLKTNSSYFFGIFDGHSGWHCSESLRLRLAKYVSLLFATPKQRNDYRVGSLTDKDMIEHLSNPNDDCLTFKFPDNFSDKQNKLGTGSKNFVEKLNTSTSGKSVSDLLRIAYNTLDSDISNESIPDGCCDEPIWTGLSGAVAISAYIKGNDVYIASTGDCRAVIGTRTSSGNYIDIPMSEDHTVDNIREVERLTKLHPGEKYAIFNGRLLGQLQPLRAFGDVIYKWSNELQNKILVPLFGKMPVANHIYLTPPYLTAEPEINHKKIDKHDRFLILATDGLWETVSNEQAVKIVGHYLDNLQRGVKPNENAATQLIRYALGMGNEHRLADVLRLPTNVRRNYHDDITVTVVYFDADCQYLKSKL